MLNIHILISIPNTVKPSFHKRTVEVYILHTMNTSIYEASIYHRELKK